MFSRLTAPLLEPSFRWLSLSSLLSYVGDLVYAVALPWAALEITGSAQGIGVVMAAWALPRAAFTLFGGAFSDRYNPRVVMMVSSGLSAIITLGMVVALLTGNASLWLLIAVALGLGIVDALHMPAANSILPRIVPLTLLDSANSVSYLIFNASFFLGPLLGGALAESALHWPFALSAGLSILAVLALVRVRLQPLSDDAAAALATAEREAMRVRPSSGLVREIFAGLRYVYKRPELRGMMILLAGFNLAIMGPYQVGTGLIAEDRFGGAAAFGAIFAAFGVGGMAGALVGGMIGSIRLHWLIVGGFVSLGIGTIAIAVLTHLPIVLALTFAVGITGGLYEPRMMAWLQRAPQPELRGRVMGAVSFLAVGLEPISHALAGWIGAISPIALFGGAGALLVIMGLWFTTTASARAMAQEAAAAVTVTAEGD